MTHVAGKGWRGLLFGAYFAVRQLAEDSFLVGTIVCIVNFLLLAKIRRDHGKHYALVLCLQDMCFNVCTYRERGVLRLRRKQHTETAVCIVILFPGIVLPSERQRQKDKQPAKSTHWCLPFTLVWVDVPQFSHAFQEPGKNRSPDLSHF